jgi:hypothetical protein
MHLSLNFTTGLLALISCVSAYNNAVQFDHDGYSLPDNHMLWGPMGKPQGHIAKRVVATTTPSTTRTADAACTNGPLTRSCWGNGFSIATDFDTKWPNTGVTVNYDFTITNTTCNPDGNGDRLCLLVNGQFPGPTIVANW